LQPTLLPRSTRPNPWPRPERPIPGRAPPRARRRPRRALFFLCGTYPYPLLRPWRAHEPELAPATTESPDGALSLLPVARFGHVLLSGGEGKRWRSPLER